MSNDEVPVAAGKAEALGEEGAAAVSEAPSRKARGRKVESLLDRFWKSVSHSEGDGCWLWKGSVDRNGYPIFRLKKGERGPEMPARTVGARRVMWLIYVGRIPHKTCIYSSCDNRRCVRPDHLRCGVMEEERA